jgi:hypothetical protein
VLVQSGLGLLLKKLLNDHSVVPISTGAAGISVKRNRFAHLVALKVHDTLI